MGVFQYVLKQLGTEDPYELVSLTNCMTVLQAPCVSKQECNNFNRKQCEVPMAIRI